MALIGPMVSGKSLAAGYLAEQFRTRGLGEASIVSTSDFITNIAHQMGITDPTRSDKQKIGAFIDGCKPHKAGMVDAVTPLVVSSDSSLKIVDSVRTEQQLKRWEELFPLIIFIYIETDEPLRHARNNIRRVKNNQTEISPDQFFEEQKAETHGGIRQLRYRARHEIINNSPMETYQSSLNDILDEYFA